MCLNPITIYNPLFGKSSYASEQGAIVKLPPHIVPSTEFIKVPCNRCVECRSSQYNAILQRGLVESMTAWSYLISLTFDNDHIPVFTFPDGKKIYYTDYSLVQLLFKRLRDSGVLVNRDFRYIVASEFGDQKHRPHVHIYLFVAKLDGDSSLEGELLRQILYNTIQNLWVINRGTRGDVQYERLFTFAQWWNFKKHRLESNYSVELVKPTVEKLASDLFSYDDSLIAPDLSDIKSTQYVLGYVQKPSQFDLEIEDYLTRYKDDQPVYQWLCRLLKSRVVYSKGLGCGFLNGRKYYLPRISVRGSSNILFYSELCDNLPYDYTEFSLLYPQLDDELRMFVSSNYYSSYRNKSWKQCLSSMTVDQYRNHCLYVKYFNKEFTNVYRSYFKRDRTVRLKVSYFYTYAHLNSYYHMQFIRTTCPEDSLVYNYLRKGVEEGISQKVPFLAFKMIGQQKFTALCRYFKERVCTYDDTVRMYNSIGVRNYEEWLVFFDKQKSTRKSNLYAGNQAKYYNPNRYISQVSCKFGKNYFSLHPDRVGTGVVNFFNLNCKVVEPSHNGV